MSVLNYKSAAALLLLAGVCGSVFAQKGGPTSVAAPKTVILSPGNCADIANGDLVSFTWNPAFQPSTASIGLARMILIFDAPGHPRGKGPMPHGDFALKAVAGKSPAGGAESVVDVHNGFYTITFRADLSVVPAGEYYMVHAVAESSVASNSAAEVPGMTNSPMSSSFCLNVTSNPVQRKKH